jgi:hypothetical protein
MSRTVRCFFALPLSLFLALPAWSQCPAGEVEVTINVITDDYGNETYWQLVPGGNVCGQDPIFIGGNPALDCSSGAGDTSPTGGYANNSTITEGPWCLTEGASYTIHSLDSWGDGHASFQVIVSGGVVGTFSAQGENAAHTFIASPPQALDMSVTKLITSLYSEEGQSVIVRGTLANTGLSSVQSYTLNYRLNGGTVVSQAITGVDLASGEVVEFEHSTPWIPDAAGSYVLEVWATEINGEDDQFPVNDLRTATLTVNTATPDIMAEYLVGAPSFTMIADDDDDLLVPRDLDFHPDRSRNELWVLNKDVAQTGGSTVRFFNPGEQDMTFLWQRDPASRHFLSLPTAIAMGDNGNFATCPGIFDANQNGGDPFTGPTLWSADPAIYAQNQFGPLGSHLDMLHVNPESQGIAHDFWNRFWLVDGYNGDVVMNDFREDHTPGQDFHGDALIRRYDAFTITRDPNNHVVSHCVMDKATGWLYVVDNGGQRVLRMNTRTGNNAGAATYGPWESYVEYTRWINYEWEVIISTGLVSPAGIDLIGDHLVVSDHATGDIIIYDKSGAEVTEEGRIGTGAAGIMGIKVGPDGRLWYVNATTHQLVRVEPQLNVGIDAEERAPFSVYPNPANTQLFLQGAVPANAKAEVRDALGRLCAASIPNDLRTGIDVSALVPGTYVLHVEGLKGVPFTVQR